MGADWPLQVSWLLEFRAFALGTGELVTKRLEFGPARLLIANGSGSVGMVLEMASEIFHLALLQRYEETVAGTRYCERSDERRVGTECVSQCRSRWSPQH